MAIINGDNSDNTLNGTASNDTINGLGGSDTLNGAGGNDNLDGGENADLYLVGPGDGFDRYNDTGTTGTDRIRATANSTVIGIRNDFSAANGIEVIDGDNHLNVIIRGDQTNNVLDFSLITLLWIARIEGGDGSDTITGSSGADVIVGGDGNDTLDGGGGSDTYVFNTGDGRDTYADTSAGLFEFDRIVVTADNVAITLPSVFGLANGIQDIMANGHSGVTIEGTGGADTYDFSVTGLIGIVSIEGAGGADNITGSTDADTINGGSGNDTLRGGRGVDTLSGGNGSDTLLGGDDNDTLIGGDGNDTLDGGNGMDTYVFNAGDGRDTYADTGVLSFFELDRIVVTADNVAITLPSVFGPANGIEFIMADGHSGVTIEGTGGNDTLDFSGTVLPGIDSIEGGGGADDIIGSTDADTINGGSGNDTLQGYGGTDTLSGGSGSDTLLGGDGSDTLIGGDGNDTLNGGGGSDTYVFNTGDGRDTYADTGTATFEFDRIVVTADNVAITLPSVFGPANGIEFIMADGHSGVTIEGTGGNDTLDFSGTVLPGIDSIDGRGGADDIIGSTDADTINGGSGNDTIQGYRGDDTINGGTGFDTAVFSGAVSGYQIVVANAALGQATVTDLLTPPFFSEGTDTLTSIQAIQFADYTIFLNGPNNAVLAANDAANTTVSTPVVLTGATLTANDFDFDGDTLEVTEVQSAVNGTVVLHPDGTIEFTPTAGFSGLASFDYVVSDGQGSTDIGSVTVTVTSPSAPPVFTSGAAAGVAENTAAATVIYDANVNDPDGGPAVFTLEGTDFGLFSIDASTGEVRFVTSPNFELPQDTGGNNVYDITIRANDGFNQVTHAVAVTVTDVNDVAPAFTSGTTANVAENTAAATVIYDANVSDPDGGAAVFTLEGTDFGLFSIDGSTGEVRFVASPNFEAPQDNGGDNTYNITIRANDGAHQTTHAVAISVTGSNDNAPAITSNGGGGSAAIVVAENTTAVTDVNAADPDLPAQTLTYSIVDVADGAKFTIDAATGVLTFITAPDFETPTDGDVNNSYIVQVQVSDGALTDIQQLTVVVTDVDESGDATASPPNLTVDQFNSGLENTAIPFTLSASLADTDGSETLQVLAEFDYPGAIIPVGAVLSDGTVANSFTVTGTATSVDITTWNWNNLRITPPADSDRDLIIQFKAISTEINGGDTAETVFHAGYVVISEGTGVQEIHTLQNLIFGGYGFRIDAPSADGNGDGFPDLTQLGRSVSSAGDVNGDGFADMIVGAFGVNRPGALYAGASYVVFGAASGIPMTLDLDLLDGTDGFAIEGIDALDNAGNSVSGGGDINGDGFADLIVGARNAGTGAYGSGETYVIYGHAGPFSATVSASTGTTLFDPFASTGHAVSDAGDVNGDGLRDLITSSGGQAYVVYGDAALPDPLDLFAMAPADGFRLYGAGISDTYSVSSAGDINGDGFDDVIVGTKTIGAGQAHVVFGGVGGVYSEIDLTTLSGTNGFRISVSTAANGLGLGYSVSSAGDVNGDGFDDLIIGAPYSAAHDDPEAGVAYVLFGKAGGWSSTVNLDALAPADGFRIDGGEADNRLAVAVSSAGDVNADGYDDMLVGAQYGGVNPGFAPTGQTYLLFGHAGGFSTLDLTSLDADDGVRLDGGHLIASVSAAGDINGDGFDDFMIGAPNQAFDYGSGYNFGLSYVIYGSDFFSGPATGSYDVAGTPGDDLGPSALVGFMPDIEIVMGKLGNDELSGGVEDVLNGGAGDDLFHFGDNKIVGGSGFDTLETGTDLNLTVLNTTAHYGQITGIEMIDLRGSGGATQLTANKLDLLHLSDETNEVFVRGDANDVVNLAETWAANGTSGIYDVYVLGAQTLYIENGVEIFM